MRSDDYCIHIAPSGEVWAGRGRPRPTVALEEEALRAAVEWSIRYLPDFRSLAKALAESLFHDERRLIRFDMSEFMEEHSVAKLIGSPPGYVGHDEGGQLSDAIRTHPYSVVLFDEIEKAHPQVLDLFLQIFDEGALTDAQGRKCDFRESVIISIWKRAAIRFNFASAPHLDFNRRSREIRGGSMKPLTLEQLQQNVAARLV